MRSGNRFILAAALALGAAAAGEAQTAPLKLVARYSMPAAVQGRFDHLTVDAAGNRLLLAAETAHEVLVFNLRSGAYERAIGGIGIPHAILVRHDLDRIYVTDGGAGALKIFDGVSYKLIASVPLKVDADSIGYDALTHLLYIDNGGGDAHEPYSMFSAVDTTAGRLATQIQIQGDTLEAMALDRDSSRIYINNRAAGRIAVVDRKSMKLVASWQVTLAKTNVAMALDEADHRLFVGCRSGAIVVFDTQSGKELQALPIPTGIDDLVYDTANHRLYAACPTGKGTVAVYAQQSLDHYTLLANVESAPGGKNEVLAPSLRRLYETIPPQGSTPGAVYVFAVQ